VATRGLNLPRHGTEAARRNSGLGWRASLQWQAGDVVALGAKGLPADSLAG